ncbi:hypothetical protein MARPO_0094s0051 [Marchantia polymorpha]|uniref:Uncharacterized protein n=1 Tax=Marchantia polymorpha TaxID=3197 RepID=A0A2R6WGA2_MARPO|nr:hypothetical protein MARPO_0094s0051 [Marchantia polymorpha]|eukprot:PTQ32877.1 hypothetical protein MARPO_0094s0051 [Marchantia polymorpha]
MADFEDRNRRRVDEAEHTLMSWRSTFGLGPTGSCCTFPSSRKEPRTVAKTPPPSWLSRTPGWIPRSRWPLAVGRRRQDKTKLPDSGTKSAFFVVQRWLASRGAMHAALRCCCPRVHYEGPDTVFPPLTYA